MSKTTATAPAARRETMTDLMVAVRAVVPDAMMWKSTTMVAHSRKRGSARWASADLASTGGVRVHLHDGTGHDLYAATCTEAAALMAAHIAA